MDNLTREFKIAMAKGLNSIHKKDRPKRRKTEDKLIDMLLKKIEDMEKIQQEENKLWELLLYEQDTRYDAQKAQLAAAEAKIRALEARLPTVPPMGIVDEDFRYIYERDYSDFDDALARNNESLSLNHDLGPIQWPDIDDSILNILPRTL